MASLSTRQQFIPRCGPPSASASVLAKHHSSYSARMADRVVHACAWADGALDVVFGDGTVLAFADHMNTFVAFPPPVPPAAREERDIQYTRWALSKYRAKVAAALACYNYYTAEPRLFAEHVVPACIQSWPHAGPLETLVLARDAALLGRQRVFRPVILSADAAREHRAQHADGPLMVPPSYPLSRLDMLSARMDPSRAVVQVCVGVDVTLWCALRRVSLTIHARGRTFTVRWPAPIPRETSADLAAASTSSTRWTVADVAAHSAMARGAAPVQVVWMEQCFPVCAPPPVWAPMLQLALELHHATPFIDDGQEESRRHEHRDCQDVGPLSYSQLPTPRPPRTTTLGHGALFSSMQTQQAHLLRAASLHQRGEWPWQRQVHGAACAVLWRLDSDPCADSPPAIYWCTAPPILADDEAIRRHLPGPSRGASAVICAVVREDESVLMVEPHGSGYGVAHATVDGCLRIYQLAADGSVGLPPVVSTLTFSADACLDFAEDGDATLMDGYDRRTEMDEALFGHHGSRAHVAAVPGSVRAQGQSYRRRAPAFPPSVVYSASSGTARGGVNDEEEEEEDEERVLFGAQGVARCGGPGHYLKAVGRVCVELAEWGVAAERAAWAQQPVPSLLSGRGSVLRDRGAEEDDDGLGGARSAAALAERADGSLFRHFIAPSSPSSPSSPMPRASRDHHHDNASTTTSAEDRVLFLTTRLDGIGNFTALTNGVIRCQFDDRTLLTLTPGLNEFDETALAASCLFRDATRCVMRVSQCRDPSHALYRYLAYALPFRRYVLMEAAARRQGYGAWATVGGEEEGGNVWTDREDALTSSSSRYACGEVHSADGPSVSAALSPFNVNRRPPPCHRSLGLDDDDRRATQLSAPPFSGRDESSALPHVEAAPPLDIYLTTLDETFEQQQWSELSALQASDLRVQSVLEESEQLRRVNEALLSDA